MVGSNHKSYTAAFKLTVVAQAEKIGNRAAAREFSVDERCVRRWRNGKGGLESMPMTKKAQRGGTAAWPELETELEAWIRMHRGESLTVLEIRTKAKLIAEQKGISNFKGTVNWCYRFMRRKQVSGKPKVKLNSQDDSSVQKSPLSGTPGDLKLSVISRAEEVGTIAAAQEFQVCECCVDRWRSDEAGLGNKATGHVCQKVHNEQKLSILKNFVCSIKEQVLTSAQITCVGEIPFSFHFVNSSESNAMPVLTASSEKLSFTCVLSCAGNGKKLKPFVIFKKKNIPDGYYPNDVIISANELGSLCPSLVLDWLFEVWSKRKPASDSSTLLLVDFQQRQPFECAKSEFEKLSTTLVVIPEVLTDLHPLPFSLTVVFEREMMKCYGKWLNSGLHSFTKGGKMRKAMPEEIAKWVSESWKSVEVSTVVRSFQKTGFISPKDAKDSNSSDELHKTEESCESSCQETVGKDKSHCDQSCVEIEDDELLTYLIASDTDQSEADEDD